jgi:hypothetical protein
VEVLDLIDSAAEEMKLDMEFEEGDVQVLSNRVDIHAREGYDDWEEEPRKRHLLRRWG